MSPSRPNATRTDIITMLRDGHSNTRIARDLHCDKPRVARIRTELGLPAYIRTEQTRTLEQKWATLTRPLNDGHVEWTGERGTSSGTPVLRYKEETHSPAAVAFRIRHGRDAVGYAIADCGRQHCVAPDHVDDETGRLAKRQTIRTTRGFGDRKALCPHGHDQSVHGRLERDGRPYCAACKREQKTQPAKQHEARDRDRATIRRDIETMLRAGIPQLRIAQQLNVSPGMVQRTRETLGLPTPRSGPPHRYGSLEEAFHVHTMPVYGGHLRWTGSTGATQGKAYVCFRQQRVPAARVAFGLHHGRPPVGQVLPSCGMAGCFAGDHLADRPMREAARQADRARQAADRRADKAFAKIFGEAA